MSFIQNYPFVASVIVLLIDLLSWQLLPFKYRIYKVAARLVLFLAYSAVIVSAGMSPLDAAPWPEDGPRHLAAIALSILWWLLAARTLTGVLGILLTRRIGHSGRLLQEVMGAVIFLIAAVAAAGYVLQLPVQGLLATSGAMAIIVGLALQSTLSDVFSGIVLNTTKPYQVDDWISIDGTEGRVVDIDWRATRLQTSQGSLAVVPNSLAAKARIINFSRPSDVHGLSISLEVSPHVRPNVVVEALERAVLGCRSLLTKPAPSVALKSSSAAGVEYEISGFVVSMGLKREVSNQLYDLAFRHLQASGVSLLSTAESNLAATISRPRALLESSPIFSTLRSEEKETFSQNMVPQLFRAGSMILPRGEVSDHLFIIESGVVSVTLFRGDKPSEAARMGPGEVIGEAGILSEQGVPADFTAKTDCLLYRVEKEYLKPCLDARHDIGEAMKSLLDHRLHAAQNFTLDVPKPVVKRGFMHWLRSRGL